jgi:hypothetical protein
MQKLPHNEVVHKPASMHCFHQEKNQLLSFGVSSTLSSTFLAAADNFISRSLAATEAAFSRAASLFS